jgi:hypothetical protein
MSDHAAEIIANLLPGTVLISEENSEIERESLRADLVYGVLHKNLPHTLDMELQSGPDSQMAFRMLQYHVELLLAYRLPVLSVVLYLFESSMPQPPFEEKSGDELLLMLKYKVIAVWKLDAQKYIQNGIIVMYTFLPAMQGANAALLLQAIQEMEQFYSREQFAKHLTRFAYVVEKSTTLSEQNRERMKEEFRMEYDSMIDDNWLVKERIARAEQQAEQRVELRVLKETVIEAVSDEFPPLVELAQQQITQVDRPEELRKLVKLIYKAPDEATARWLLTNFAA